ncbi:MAG: MFS transporter [Chloroflexi bacterium]|nr:MFS transporter [Chloroflexota bacterium]
MTNLSAQYRAVALSTLAFTICFAAWMINGVLVAFLVDKGVYAWNVDQVGWLIGIPVLTGAVLRLPIGVLTDKYGGRIVFTVLMLLSAVPMYLVSYANTYYDFMLTGLGFGLSGASFAVGVAYVSLWFRRDQQGTVLGLFGLGNAGAALTSIGAPIVLAMVTDQGANLDGWRALPKLYAVALVVTAVIFFLLAPTKMVEQSQKRTFVERLAPLRNVRVWRFGFYYFFAFGSFVGLSMWLIAYYVNVYSMSVTTAGMIAAFFSLPAGLVRAVGGWLSDRTGARVLMYFVLGTSLVCMVLLFVPRMEVSVAGEGVTAKRPGTVTAVSTGETVIGQDVYKLRQVENIRGLHNDRGELLLVFPIVSSLQEPMVRVGDEVAKGQLIARGVTHVYFQANVWIFTGLVFIVGMLLGVGTAAIFKHVADYFPTNVGLVGGLVGVLGALGGFFSPIIFGYLLRLTGIWTVTWMFLAFVALACLVWMHLVVRSVERNKTTAPFRRIEEAVTKDSFANEPVMDYRHAD